ncbi:RDD family protein [Chryseobacterium sp. JUb7]|uniref:RDD family protein n=1 Tax=Chryseobacterium sp. JUb7 TaxID=2940599 RepID=UPI00216871B9|nr:RDD family protein [Chryseobacterium sp. JUb7]MCS3531590.1 putative RDD family membrane protein YckC [Chryseobacterium sp. JUb7]
MKKYLRIIERHKVSLWTRFAHLLIDRVIIFLLFVFYGAFSAFVYQLFNITFFVEMGDKISSMNRFEDILLTSLIYFLYTFLMEYFTNGKTIGKYITGSRVISTDGTPPSFNQYLIRNISRLVPFEPFSFFTVDGWHDNWSDTRVINIKNYLAEKQTKDDINSIGAK